MIFYRVQRGIYPADGWFLYLSTDGRLWLMYPNSEAKSLNVADASDFPNLPKHILDEVENRIRRNPEPMVINIDGIIAEYLSTPEVK